MRSGGSFDLASAEQANLTRTLNIMGLPRTLAALADAHDEHMLIVRLADTGKVDGVDFQQELHRQAGEGLTTRQGFIYIDGI